MAADDDIFEFAQSEAAEHSEVKQIMPLYDPPFGSEPELPRSSKRSGSVSSADSQSLVLSEMRKQTTLMQKQLAKLSSIQTILLWVLVILPLIGVGLGIMLSVLQTTSHH
jgi:hypothetical protein